MSTLMTDSKVLMELLDFSLGEDNTLNSNIAALKQCAFNCMELQVTGYSMGDEELAEKAKMMGVAVVEAWQTLSALKKDFENITNTKKGGMK